MSARDTREAYLWGVAKHANLMYAMKTVPKTVKRTDLDTIGRELLELTGLSVVNPVDQGTLAEFIRQCP